MQSNRLLCQQLKQTGDLRIQMVRHIIASCQILPEMTTFGASLLGFFIFLVCEKDTGL